MPSQDDDLELLLSSSQLNHQYEGMWDCGYTRFSINLNELKHLMSKHGYESVEALNNHGGINGLCNKLRTDPSAGLNESEPELEFRRDHFGTNKLPREELIPFLFFLLKACRHNAFYIFTSIAFLSIASSFAKGFFSKMTDNSMGSSNEWIDGLAILLCMFVTSVTHALTDYFRHREFLSLDTRLADKKIPVVRNGHRHLLQVEDILVGDVCSLSTGSRIPADGMLIDGTHLIVDESAMTGICDLTRKDERRDVSLLTGTCVRSGQGRMVVTNVGVHTQAGIYSLADAHLENISCVSDNLNFYTFPKERSTYEAIDNDSGLQKKLSQVTFEIIKFSIVLVIVLIPILALITLVKNDSPFEEAKFSSELIEFILIGVSILITATLESLPMSTAIGLAYTIKQILKDNCLVRNINACEKLSNVTSICCDKTGVLTTNRMTVVVAFINQVSWKTLPQLNLLPTPVGKLIVESITYNCSYLANVFYGDEVDASQRYVGDRTECALLNFVQQLGHNYHALRKKIPEEDLVYVYPFDSERKLMSTVIQTEHGYRVFTKGATDVILRKCSWFYAEDCTLKRMTAKYLKTFLYKIHNSMANDGLRIITLAYRDLKENKNWEIEAEVVTDMVLLCILGIDDPICPGIPQAIKQCQQAGITVRMLTGDNIHTAYAIARKCGILEKDENHLILDGKILKTHICNEQGFMSQPKMDQIWPDLRVLAGCTSKDKYLLVKGIQENKIKDKAEVVAVTGRTTKDALALKIADVGFGLGITGTDVTKKSCDIVLLDDSFESILKAILWSRNFYENFCNFLTFQLIANMTAFSLTVIMTSAQQKNPLATSQIIYVSISVCFIGSTYLATEKPNETIMSRPPYRRNCSIISDKLIVNVLGHSLYQLSLLIILIFFGDKIFDVKSGRSALSDQKKEPSEHYTIVFNVYTLLNLFNLLNYTKTRNRRCIFKWLFDDTALLIIWSSLFAIHFMIVEYGENVFLTKSLTWEQWIRCLVLAWSIFPWNHLSLAIQHFFNN